MSLETFTPQDKPAQTYEGKHRGSDEDFTSEQNIPDYEGRHRQEDHRDPSPMASVLRRFANALERRAVNKAHGEALTEDTERKISAQSEAYASYDDNITRSQDIDTAYAMNEQFDARVARQEKIDAAKENVRDIGRRAVEALKSAGLITLGAGLIAGEFAADKAKQASEATKRAAETGTQKVADTKEVASDMISSVRERLARRKEKALTRKYEREAKERKRRALASAENNTIQENVKKISTKERLDKIKWNARAIRTAGRVALLTFKDTREALK